MKKFKEDGIQVIEYDFEDYTSGKLGDHIKLFTSTSNRELVDVKTKNRVIYRIKPWELNRIEEDLKEKFYQSVKVLVDKRTEFFRLRYDDSENKDIKINNEIEKYEIRFGIKSGDRILNHIHYPAYHTKYKVDLCAYSLENFLPTSPIVYFETDYQFYKWLKETYWKPVQQVESDKHSQTPAGKKIPAKYYALYHCILIEMGKEKQFEKNRSNRYNKTAIENFASNRYKNVSPQSFYNHFRDFNLTNRLAIARELGEGYKDIIILISNNDAEVIAHLKNYPN